MRKNSSKSPGRNTARAVEAARTPTPSRARAARRRCPPPPPPCAKSLVRGCKRLKSLVRAFLAIVCAQHSTFESARSPESPRNGAMTSGPRTQAQKSRYLISRRCTCIECRGEVSCDSKHLVVRSHAHQAKTNFAAYEALHLQGDITRSNDLKYVFKRF